MSTRYRRTNATPYLLRDIPDELWSACRARAEREGRTMREVLLALLDAYRRERRIPADVQAIRREKRTA